MIQLVVVVSLLGVAEEIDHGAVRDERIEFFEKNVRPVFVERCHGCHSGTAKQIRGELRLDSRDAFRRGGRSGPVVVPGNPGASRLLRALRHDSASELKMPPSGRLPESVIRDFETWIAAGAVFPSALSTRAERGAGRDSDGRSAPHWAFEPLRRPRTPVVRRIDWPINEIDRFILARLENGGIAPSPEADPRELVRRVYSSLVGLPPTYDEIEAFVRDESPEAYARLVDRLLGSPRYGERWARHWLDVARYSDAKGYVDAGEPRFPFAYAYRDYVVRAFNEDLPFDRFVLEQLAADQLDRGGARSDNRSLAALGFLTVGSRFNFFPHEVIDDRIDVVTRGLMGLTVSCARCHDHKYDPVSTEDYYALYGVFASSREPPASEYPVLRSGDTTRAESDELRAALAKAKKDYGETRAKLHRQIQHELRAWIGDYLRYIVETTPAHRTQDQPELRTDRGLLREFSAYGPGAVGRWRRFIAERGENDRVFGAWNRLMALDRNEFEAQALNVIAALDSAGHLNPILRRAIESSPPANMADVANVYGEILEACDEEWRAHLESAPAATLFDDLSREELRLVLYGADSPASVSVDESEDYYHLDEHSNVRTKFANIERVFLKHTDAFERAMVLVDRERPVEPRVFRRGNAEDPGEPVERRVPDLLAAFSPGAFPSDASGRLELARAIVHPENPLTARVIVNRVWAWHFGRGLVETPSDFGTRSAPPVHSELLDFLASWFVDQSWSMKKLHRLILNSRTYRQSSVDRAECRTVDAENELYWRMNRRRLDFESMRDAMLAVAGRLDARVGGRAVTRRPDDPESSVRTIYLFVDREKLPGLFRVFDFPSPNLSAAERPSTTVPQQALFLLNSPFVIARAEDLARRIESVSADAGAERRIRLLYRAVYGRDPDGDELALTERFVRRHETRSRGNAAEIATRRRSADWRYGFGAFDPVRGRLKSFTPLPHFTGSAWQGAEDYPDGSLHYLRLDATGGHVGVDREHAAVRRWIAPRTGVVAVLGTLRHGREDCGDGVRARIVTARGGSLGEWIAYKSEVETSAKEVAVVAGETVDFVADCRENHLCDEFEWAPVIRYVDRPATSVADGGAAELVWDAARDFDGMAASMAMSPWATLAQSLLQSNEFLFVD